MGKLLFCLLLALSAVASAEDAQTNAELSQVESGIDTVKQDLQRLTQEREALQDQLAGIEKHYGETAARLRTLHLQIQQKRDSLDNIRLDMQAYQNDIDKLEKELATQVKAAYAMGQQEKLKLLLNQKDPALSSRMMVYFNYINQERLAKLKSIEKVIKLLGELDKKKQFETRELEHDVEETKREQANLDAHRKSRSQLLAKLNNEFSSGELQLNQLQENQNRLKSLMESLPITEEELAVDPGQATELPTSPVNPAVASSDFSALKGKLPWPINGRIAHNFGSPRAEGVWDGVLIDAKEGLEIQAVTEGKVAYAGELRGYGLLTIIDHGQGYMTLYAYNQSLYKQKGETVEAGEIIASVGLSGGQKQAGLYFGIRKQGIPIDPLEWCQK
ncbi:MAG: peptidoglycan DD-metalloendopeptidase family protein [Methylococcales bacterium]|nr:peptidoglycan DD-metalloendopeptidase family protein [Methylococcales bacterium]